MKRKYYVEFLSKNDWETKEQYFAQSLWLETIEECLKFVEDWFRFHNTRFDYQEFTDSFKYFVMYADFEDNGRDFGDIEQLGEIVYNERAKIFELLNNQRQVIAPCRTEKDLFRKAYNDYKSICFAVNGYDFEESKKILWEWYNEQAFNEDDELYDVNFGTCCFTIFNKNGKAIVGNSIEVYNDKEDSCLGDFTIDEIAEKGEIEE